MTVRVGKRQKQGICPWCRAPEWELDSETCPGCGAVLHSACLEEHGRDCPSCRGRVGLRRDLRPGALPPAPGEECPWGMTGPEWLNYCWRCGIESGSHLLWQPPRLCWCGRDPKPGPHANHRWRCGYDPSSDDIRGCGRGIGYIGWCSEDCRRSARSWSTSSRVVKFVLLAAVLALLGMLGLAFAAW